MENKEEVPKTTKDIAASLRSVIGNNVRDMREEISRQRLSEGDKKFTQEVLARELAQSGYSVQSGQIGHVENATKFPSIPLLVALADFFGTSLDFIVGRTKNLSSIAAIDEDLQTGGISGRLGDIYKKLPLERQEEVYRFAEALNLIVQTDLPQIAPLPLNRRQRRKSAVRALLDLIQRERGTAVRDEIEETLRSKGIPIDLEP